MIEVDRREPRKKYVPEISQERLQELASRIKPVIRYGEGPDGLFQSPQGFPHHIEDVDLEKVAYTWDPTPTERVEGLIEAADIRTYHSWGYYGFFKPSIAEVLAAIPEELADQVVAFEIVDHPTSTDNMSFDDETKQAFDAGYHWATTRLYTKAE